MIKQLRNIILIITTLVSPVVLADDSIIKIGSILILTGEGAAWGQASKNGIDMAIDEINSKGGINGKKLKAYHQDDRGDPKNSISAFKHLTEIEDVNLIIGTNWSNTGLPLVDLALSKKVIMISPSLGVASFNEANDFLFNTWPHDYILSEKLAEYVFNKGHRNIALIGAENVWVNEQTASFKKKFEQLGGKISYMAEPLPATSDLRSEAIKIKNKKDIDAYVSTTDGVLVGSLVAKSLKDLNSTLPTYSITLDQSAIDAAQGGFEKLEFLTFLTPSDKFKSNYESRYKTTIDIGADTSYDAVMMLATAMESTNSQDTETLSKYLSSLKSYQGVSGNLISDGKRAFTKNFIVKKVVDGKPVDLQVK